MIEEQRAAQTVLMNQTDRRKSSRTSIRRLAYVNLDPYDNGGVITEISRDGLRFHMVNPVEQGGLLRLSILLGGTSPIQVVGELIWMDPPRKIGGVRFTVLPEGAADQILNWAEAANATDISKSGASRRSGRINHPSDLNPADLNPTPRAKPDPAAQKIPATSIPIPSASPQAPLAQAAAESKPPRLPWVPPPARPPVGAEPDQARSSDLHAAGAVGPQPGMKPGAPRQPAAIPAPIPTAASPAMPWITHFDPDPPAREWSFVRGVLGGVLLCAVLGLGALLALRYGGWPNVSLPFNGPVVTDPARPLASNAPLPPAGLRAEVNKANSQGQQAPPATSQQAQPPLTSGLPPNANMQRLPDTQPASSSASASGGSAVPEVSASPQTPQAQDSIAASASAATLNSEGESSPPASQPVARPPAGQPPRPDTGESQLLLARQYLDGRVQPRNPTVASQLLWVAVEKGNSAAEMDLADLYLHGDGVARNCDQARVLLSVASEKGNPEAMEKLRELNRTGCR